MVPRGTKTRCTNCLTLCDAMLSWLSLLTAGLLAAAHFTGAYNIDLSSTGESGCKYESKAAALTYPRVLEDCCQAHGRRHDVILHGERARGYPRAPAQAILLCVRDPGFHVRGAWHD